jgi:hypothetical protein
LTDDFDSFLISKEVLPSLEGFGFVETVLGDPNGSLKQYRNSTGVHVREYKEYFEVHKDRFDPRVNPARHLLYDSPETLLAFGAASLLTRGLSSKRESEKYPASAYGNPLAFLRIFLSLNHFFRFLKKLLF